MLPNQLWAQTIIVSMNLNFCNYTMIAQFLVAVSLQDFFANFVENSNARQQIRPNSNLKVFEGSWW